MENKIKELEEKLRIHNEKYYNGDNTNDMSDEEFDSLKNTLRALDPNNSFLNEVGKETISKERAIKHKYPMLSIKDVKNVPDAVKWINSMYDKFNPETELEARNLFIEYKIDGTSGSYHYNKDGKFCYAVTRGDGNTGNRIMWPDNLLVNGDKLPYKFPMRLIENYVKGSFEIRGEFAIPLKFKNLDIFKEKALRNLCSGTLNRLEKNEVMNYIRFYPYQIWGEKEGLLPLDLTSKIFKEISHSFSYIEETSNREIILVDEIESYYLEYLVSRDKGEIPFETDGLVLSFPIRNKYDEIDKNFKIKTDHMWNLALKPPTKKATSLLEKIEWNVSRTGRIVPIGIITPVKIGNVNISNITLNNKQFIVDNEITIGSIIEIERANDVIPKFLRVIEKSNNDFDIPTKCPVCGSKLQEVSVDLICNNPECQGKLVNEIVYWLKDLHGADGIAEATVKKLVLNSKPSIKSIVDFYEFILLDKFGYIINGEVERDHIYNTVKNTLNDISELSIMEGIGITGIKRAKLMKMGIYNIKNLKSFKARPGMSEDEKKVMEWIKNKKNIDKLNKFYTYFKKYLKERVFAKDGWKICVTGSFKGISRKELIKKIEKRGCIYVNKVSPSTRYLINDDNNNSSKMEDAIKYGVHIISMKEFFDLLDAK